MKEILRLGVLQPPPRPVRLLVVASEHSAEKTKETRRVLAAHLIERSHLTAHPGGHDSLLAVGASGGRDTIATIWTKNKYGRGFGLTPFSLVNTRLHFYDPKSGKLLSNEALKMEAESARRDSVTLIAVVLLDDDLASSEHDQLMREFRQMKACPIKFSSLEKRSASVEISVDPKWLNLALILSQKAGAVPWDLTDLPGVDEKTVFVGIDLGHNHARNRSQLAFTLIDYRGRPLDRRIIPCPRNDERIPSEVLHRELPRLIFERDGARPTGVIVHRDGCYVHGESDDIIEAVQDEILLLTLVGIKKDTCTRMNAEQLEGACLELDQRRAILVTNAQARRRSMPVPVEIELVYSNHLSLKEVVSQVFWLTRVCQGNAFNPRRLPVTTAWANNLASTGSRKHLKGWDYCEE
jgi:hypothetical protein